LGRYEKRVSRGTTAGYSTYEGTRNTNNAHCCTPRLCLGNANVIDIIRNIVSHDCMTQLQHYDESGTVRFITITCHNKLRLFQQPHLCELFCHHLMKFRVDNRVKLFAYVLMPNHIHMVLSPPADLKLGIAIGQLKGRFAHEVLKQWRDQNLPILTLLKVNRGRKQDFAFWMPRCFDYNCRTNRQVLTKIQYCHNNPIRAGLVTNLSDWLWSSYHWYQGDKDGIIKIDDLPI